VVEALRYRRKVSGSIPDAIDFFFNLPNSFSRIRSWALGYTQPLTEMSNRNRIKMLLGSRVRPARKADNLTAVCEPTV
jgi:hypothetical protein